MKKTEKRVTVKAAGQWGGDLKIIDAASKRQVWINIKRDEDGWYCSKGRIDTAELEAAFLARYGKFPSTYEKSRI
jgi:hypothetical protein